MADFNMVNVDSQGQVGKTVDNTNLNILKRDIRDYQELCPILKSLQQSTSKILKDYHEYQEKKDRKTAGLPYHLIRKFEGVRSTLMKAKEILTYQCRFYQYSVGNRQYQKNEEQYFFRKTMKSYDQRRLWMKGYILRMEGQVQVVEQQVKKNVEYQTHKYSQFLNDLNVERLEHNYEDKLEALQKAQAAMRKNIEFRAKIKAKIELLTKREEKNIAESVQTRQVNELKVEEAKATNVQPSPTKVVPKLAQITRMLSQTPSFCSLLYIYLTKQFVRHEFFRKQLKFLLNQKNIYSYKNQQLKIAIDLIKQKIEANNNEFNIVYQSYLSELQYQQTKNKIKIGQKLTKTDFFIYLKQLHRSVQQLIKRYGFSFNYILMDKEVMKNHGRSRSAMKKYKMKRQSQQIDKYQQSRKIKCLQKYREQNLSDILQRREWQKVHFSKQLVSKKDQQAVQIDVNNQAEVQNRIIEKVESQKSEKINQKQILPTSEGDQLEDPKQQQEKSQQQIDKQFEEMQNEIKQQYVPQIHENSAENKQNQKQNRQQTLIQKPFPQLAVQIEQQQFKYI